MRGQDDATTPAPRRAGKRRRLLFALALFTALAAFAPSCITGYVGGAWSKRPADLSDGLSPAARVVLNDALQGLDPTRLLDHHVHLAGVGAGGSGCEVNPELTSWLHPRKRARYEVYLSASGVTDIDKADIQFFERLDAQARFFPMPGHFLLLAFDRHYNADGTRNAAKTEFHVPDAWARQLAARRPDRFVHAISVHPYRADALQALERGAAAGARAVKWLPNAQGIDPADPRVDAYYAKMKALGLVLISHGGLEKAVEADADQRLGNPLRLRRALDAGVRVIVAHCASRGMDEDLDRPDRPLVSSFDLFLRLMDDKRYVGRIYGDISALVLSGRMGRPLRTMLSRTDLHSRLVNGSDYPLPAINVLVRTRAFQDEGFIDARQRAALNEIYDHNPLLFDLVLKRTIKHPESGARFAPGVFLDHPDLRLLGPPPGRPAGG